MDESLLGHDATRVPVAEEDEELWNALHEPDRDHTHHHQAAAPHTGTIPGVQGMMQGMRAHYARQFESSAASAPGHGDRESDAFLRASPSSSSSSTASPLPSLRAHVHLPAISSLFQGISNSAKAMAGGGNSLSSTSSSLNAPDEHGRIANLDAFLINLYNYFYHKGFWSIAVVEMTSLFTGLFTVSLSSFVVGCVDWQDALQCRHNATHGCHQELEHFVSCHPANPSLLYLAVAFYFALFLVYWFSRVLRLTSMLRDAYAMGVFYTQRLAIDSRQLQTIKWDEIVDRVLALVGPSSVNVPRHLKQISSYRLQIDPALLSTPHDFARRIMRRENYLIAFMNHSLFQDSKLLPPSLQFASTAHVMFSRNMEANLTICLIDHMFDGDQNLATSFLSDVPMLQKRFMVAGVFNLVLTPFILLYRVFHFFFNAAQEWHSNRGIYIVSRRWSSYAQWKFREYNELPHALEARMARSYPLTTKYLAMFPDGLMGVVARGVAFCASSLMAVLLAISLMEESVLLETTWRGHQLIWYMTLATVVFVWGRSFGPEHDKSPFLLQGDCEEAMLQISAETHYFPKEWRGQCHLYDVRDAFLALFPTKMYLLFHECLSVIMTPYVLCVALPNCTRELLLFIRSHTLSVPNVGAVCRYAEYDFKQYGHDAKMEASFISFKQNHPKWVGAEEGEHLMARLGRVKHEELEKSMRMGDTMLFNSQVLSMSQQLMQSQAIHTALGGGLGMGMGMGMDMSSLLSPMPQENEFYWLEKLHQRGELLDDSGLAGIREEQGGSGSEDGGHHDHHAPELALSSVHV